MLTLAFSQIESSTYLLTSVSNEIKKRIRLLTYRFEDRLSWVRLEAFWSKQCWYYLEAPSAMTILAIRLKMKNRFK